MFYETYTARKPPSVCAPVTAKALQCIVNGDMTQQFSQFCPWWPWSLTMTFKLVLARDQTRLGSEFGANPFSGSRVIWATNKRKRKLVTDSAKNRTLLACMRFYNTPQIAVVDGHNNTDVTHRHTDRQAHNP